MGKRKDNCYSDLDETKMEFPFICFVFVVLKLFFFFFCLCGGKASDRHMWRSEDNLQESLLMDICIQQEAH